MQKLLFKTNNLIKSTKAKLHEFLQGLEDCFPFNLNIFTNLKAVGWKHICFENREEVFSVFHGPGKICKMGGTSIRL